MSAKTIENNLAKIKDGAKISPAEAEILKAVFSIIAWQNDFFDLDQNKKAVDKYISDFNTQQKINSLNVNTAAGFAGYAVTMDALNESIDKETYILGYADKIKSLSITDFNYANAQSNILLRTFGRNYKTVFDEYNAFVELGIEDGLTTNVIRKAFKSTDIYKDNLTLRDSLGRKWEPVNWVEMFHRTRTGQVVNDVTQLEMIDNGMVYYQVSNHNTQTPFDKQFEGKRFSIDSAFTKYPYDGGIRPIYHPNCLHIMLPIN